MFKMFFKCEASQGAERKEFKNSIVKSSNP